MAVQGQQPIRATPRAEARAPAHAGRPLSFVAAALLASWVPWLVLLASTGDPFAAPTSMLLWIAGGYGPPLAACLVVAVDEGRPGLRRLGQGLGSWRLGGWYLVLLLPLPVVIVAVGVTVAVGEAPLETAGLTHWSLVPAMLLSGVLLGGFEEVGWRGYLLPVLQRRTGALLASVIIGLVWALWHAPLFWLASTAQASFSPLWFTVHAVALSVVLTWAFNGTGGSLLLAVLLHGAVNGWYDAVLSGLAPEAVTTFLRPAAVVWLLLAVWFTVRSGSRDLAAQPRVRW
jgi:uncharacterized protein